MNIDEAIEILNTNYYKHVWDHNDQGKTPKEQMEVPFPGEENEEIVISVHKDVGIFQKFHYHNFFFINFALQGDFKALTRRDDTVITIHENDCYMAQPHSGYAVVADPNSHNTIVAILIRRDAFFHEFFAPLSRFPKLFDFFLSGENDPDSDAAFYVPFEDASRIRTLVELMCIEYASKTENTQSILKPLVLSLFLYLIHQYEKIADKPEEKSFSTQLETYIRDNCAHITLKEVADHFAYHPNYISFYLKKELGKGFSQLVLEQRMDNAKRILMYSSLSIEETAEMVGYSNPSNFYKAFKEYFQMTPRQFTALLDEKEKA